MPLVRGDTRSVVQAARSDKKWKNENIGKSPPDIRSGLAGLAWPPAQGTAELGQARRLGCCPGSWKVIENGKVIKKGVAVPDGSASGFTNGSP